MTSAGSSPARRHGFGHMGAGAVGSQLSSPLVGTWGPALFSDDTADDVRSMYRELIEGGVDDDEATRQVLTAFDDVANDPDYGPVLWLALAFTQSKVGRLAPDVAANALGVIDRGDGLERWAEDPKLLARRRAAVEKVRQQLVGPQPARKRLRPPKKHYTNLERGDLFVYRSGVVYVALRVARIKSNRSGESPILVVLDYEDPVKPTINSDLPDRVRGRWNRPGGTAGPWADVIFQPVFPSLEDLQALTDLGFEKIGTLPPRPGDDEIKDHWGGGWLALSKGLDRYVANTPRS